MEPNQNTLNENETMHWRLGKFLASMTAPTLVYGFALGIAFAVTAALAIQADLVGDILVALVAILAVSILGAIAIFVVSQRFIKSSANSTRIWVSGSPKTLSGPILKLMAISWKREATEEDLQEVMEELSGPVKIIAGVAAATVTRILSLSFLLSVLAGAMSFAIFAATFMQVKRLDVQNRLIESQLHLAEAQRQTALSASLERLEVAIEALSSQSATNAVKMSPGMAVRIAALSRQFRPYRFVEYPLAGNPGNVADDPAFSTEEFPAVLTSRPLSQERSRLLQQLLFANFVDFQNLYEQSPSFQFADFRGYQLRHRNLACLNLQFSDFRRADGFAAVFAGSELTRADFRFASLLGANFSSASVAQKECPASVNSFVKGDDSTDLSEAKFDYAQLNNSQFKNAELRDASFVSAILFGANFEGADIEGVDFTSAVIAIKTVDTLESSILERFLGADPAATERFLDNWEIREETVSDHPFLDNSGNDDSVYLTLHRRQ